MIEFMNQQKFGAELRELICRSDWMERYFAEQARKYHRIDYWGKSALGLLGLVGAALLGNTKWAWLGGLFAGGCAFVIGTVIPNFKWDSIVGGFKNEREAWTRIRQGYEDLLRVSEMSDKGEILLQEFQRVKEMQKAAALDEKDLPKNEKLLLQMEQRVRDYYRLDLKGDAA